MRISVLVILLFSAISVHAEAIDACRHPDSGYEDVEELELCGSFSEDGVLAVSKRVLENVVWSESDLACIYVLHKKFKGWYYISKNGVGRPSPLSEDNDCDLIEEGLTRSISNGTVVYVDRSLTVVKATKYKYASNFWNGYALVCVGDLKKERDKFGDHYDLKGGECGYINREFKVVVPLKYTYENVPRP